MRVVRNAECTNEHKWAEPVRFTDSAPLSTMYRKISGEKTAFCPQCGKIAWSMSEWHLEDIDGNQTSMREVRPEEYEIFKALAERELEVLNHWRS